MIHNDRWTVFYRLVGMREQRVLTVHTPGVTVYPSSEQLRHALARRKRVSPADVLNVIAIARAPNNPTATTIGRK
jgi:hypothetical protein